ncbi:hypothetical protein NIIDMKKI_24470 [Mycobacterium kansasii]|uniref:3'(2'),5-bisphosphonucleoside 3'(2')-phosphohydrolase n=1 Tax=Mycobacterium kansasii TaxID=1768 RepID=A0A7G1I869_MYCKA|nr:hypothetical protein NIIDMKKI_24470 [Mycobacterium kansasii]
MQALAMQRPADAVLSEEGADDPVRVRSARVWIIDPLDGTREFSELGREDWAVHVALWQTDELVAGAVALPAQGITLATPRVQPPPAASGRPRIVVSRTRAPAIALAVRDALHGTLVEMGSAGAKVAAVVQGSADVYVHAGGQYEWDSAAPVAVARSAGLHASASTDPPGVQPGGSEASGPGGMPPGAGRSRIGRHRRCGPAVQYRRYGKPNCVKPGRCFSSPPNDFVSVLRRSGDRRFIPVLTAQATDISPS